MPDALYDHVGYLLGTGQINWLFNQFSAILVTDDYVYSSTDTDTSILDPAWIGGSGLVNFRTVTPAGILTSEQVTIDNVPAGTYNVLLTMNTLGGNLLLAYYEAAVTLTESENVVIRPYEADLTGIGKWVQL